jgi:serine/threonine-protein kinase RIO1
VVKRYNIKNTWHGLKRGFRHSRAWASWRYAHLLAFLGIPTPKPIALLERRWGPFRSTAYFITDFADGIDAYNLLHSDKAKESKQEGLVKQFGEIIQMLADASITHGDFKATNFIITDDGLTIVDLDAMYEHRNKWNFRRAFRRDLRRFMDNWVDLPEVSKMFREELSGLEL